VKIKGLHYKLYLGKLSHLQLRLWQRESVKLIYLLLTPRRAETVGGLPAEVPVVPDVVDGEADESHHVRSEDLHCRRLSPDCTSPTFAVAF